MRRDESLYCPSPPMRLRNMNDSERPVLPNLDLLMSWVAIVETGSVSEAARLQNLSQAAVSQRVKQLEGMFATPLLDRTTRPALPTAAGQRLFESAKELTIRSSQMMESVRNVSRARRIIVRFGCVDSFAATVGPNIIRALSSSTHQIRLWSGITPELEKLIESRQLDMAITTGQAPLPGLTRTPLFSERYVVAVPAGLDTDHLGSLSDLSRSLDFIRYSTRSMIGQQVDHYLQRMGDAVERTFEFDATDPLLSLVASGMGFALTTPLCIWQSRQFLPQIRVLDTNVFSKRDKPYPEFSRSFQLAYRDGELGSLPHEVKGLVRVALNNHLVDEIRTRLDLSGEIMRVYAGDE